MKKQTKPTRRSSNGRSRPRGTGASYVYDSLKSQILDLELQPGTFLDETELSRQFGVSRSPVREALIRLSAERLVQNLRNRTSIVAPFDVADLPAFFDAMMLLYRLSARLAASRPDPVRIERLRAIHKEHEAALKRGDMKSMVRLNRAFHTGIAEMTGNSFIVDWMEGLLDQGQRVLRLYAHHLGDVLSSAVLKPHRDMLAAIEVGDARRAEEAGRQDANTLVEDFQRNLSNLPTSQIALQVKQGGK